MSYLVVLYFTIVSESNTYMQESEYARTNSISCITLLCMYSSTTAMSFTSDVQIILCVFKCMQGPLQIMQITLFVVLAVEPMVGDFLLQYELVRARYNG